MSHTNRSFQRSKQELAEFDARYLQTIVDSGDIALARLRGDFQAGLVSETAVEFTEISQQLAEIGLWIVRREQQSRRN